MLHIFINVFKRKFNSYQDSNIYKFIDSSFEFQKLQFSSVNLSSSIVVVVLSSDLSSIHIQNSLKKHKARVE